MPEENQDSQSLDLELVESITNSNEFLKLISKQAPNISPPLSLALPERFQPEKARPKSSKKRLTSEQITEALASQQLSTSPIPRKKSSTQNGTESSTSSQRGLLLLRIPKMAFRHFDRIPAAVKDQSCYPCILILPSDKPASRQDAVTAEQFVSRAIATPSRAADTAFLWRKKQLNDKCATAMDALRQDNPEGWVVRQQGDDSSLEISSKSEKHCSGAHQGRAASIHSDPLSNGPTVDNSTMPWDGHCHSSVVAALIVSLAEVVRQIEVGCSDRARLFVKIWNHLLELMEGPSGSLLQAGIASAMKEAATLSAEVLAQREQVLENGSLNEKVLTLERRLAVLEIRPDGM